MKHFSAEREGTPFSASLLNSLAGILRVGSRLTARPELATPEELAAYQAEIDRLRLPLHSVRPDILALRIDDSVVPQRRRKKHGRTHSDWVDRPDLRHIGTLVVGTEIDVPRISADNVRFLGYASLRVAKITLPIRLGIGDTRFCVPANTLARVQELDLESVLLVPEDLYPECQPRQPKQPTSD